MAIGQAKQPVGVSLRVKKFYRGAFPLQIREVETGTLVKELKGHQEGTYGVCFDATGERLGSAGADGSVKIWELKTEQKERTLKGHIGSALAVDFNPKGDRITSSGIDGKILAWDLETDRSKVIGRDSGVLHGLALGAKQSFWDDRVFCVRFTPDGKSIVAGSRSGLKAYDATGSGTLPLFQLQIGVVKRWWFSPDGSTLITVGNQIHAWDTASGSRRYTLEGQGSKVLELAFNAGGDRLFAGLMDGRILCWNVLTGELLEDVAAHEQRISQFRFTPDSKYLLTSGADKTVAYWAVSPLKELSRWKFDEVPGTAAFTQDNKTMAFAFSNGEIQILDAASGELRCKIQGHGGDPFAFATREVTRAGVSSMAFSEDGSRLATFGVDETLKLWDATSGENVLDVPAKDLLGGKIVEFSQNRILLASSRKWIELSANAPVTLQGPPSPSVGGEDPN
jgi:WD40 repeat protein